jgi:endonuclease G
MTLRPFVAGLFTLSFALQPLRAQTVDERLTRLEEQVEELRDLLGLTAVLDSEFPVELIGNEHVQWGFPGGGCTFLTKDHYVTCHNNEYLVPDWVAYHLTRDNLQGNTARTDNFRADPELPEGERAVLADYRRSGYDRGHMAPAAAFQRSREAMSETFVLSNMAPQRPNLNRRIWRILEEQVRSLAEAHGNIWVFTGPLYLDANGDPAEPTVFIGPTDVAVPTHFYKAILCEHTTGTVETFAFIMENRLQPLVGQPSGYLVSVDSVEALSGLDFFAALPDTDEDRLEALIATNWPIR